MNQREATILAAVVAVLGTAALVLVETALIPALRADLYDLIVDPNAASVSSVVDGIATALVWTLPESVVCVALFAWLHRRWSPRHADPETRCRRCRYVLRGLTRPQCPECGEWV